MPREIAGQKDVDFLSQAVRVACKILSGGQHLQGRGPGLTSVMLLVIISVTRGRRPLSSMAAAIMVEVLDISGIVLTMFWIVPSASRRVVQMRIRSDGSPHPRLQRTAVEHAV
jgi:hypothetical protein